MLKTLTLSPVQRLAYDRLLGRIAVGEVVVLRGAAGAGKTTILQHIHASMGGALVGVRQFIDQVSARGPLVIEEAFLGMLDEALAKHGLVLVDDLHLISNPAESYDFPRTLLLDAGLTAVLGDAVGQRKKIIFTTSAGLPWPVRRRAYVVELGPFGPLDYGALHRFAPALNAQAAVRITNSPRAGLNFRAD